MALIPVSSRNGRSAVLMLAAVAFFGSLPLFIALGRQHNPFLYGGVMRLGILVVSLLVLAILYGPLLRDRSVLAFFGRRIFRWEMVGVLASYFEFAVLVFALRWADAGAVAVLFEIWPILLILIVSRWTGQRYRALNWHTVLLAGVAFVGVVLVMASQGDGGLSGLLEFSPLVWAGFGLALGAALLAAGTGFGWVWTHNVLGDAGLPVAFRRWRGAGSPEFFFLLVGFAVSNLSAVALIGAIGLAYGGVVGNWIDWNGLLLALLGGSFIGAGSLLWRYATTLTGSVGIHAMGFGTPVFALAFLAVAGQVGAVHWGWLAGGCAAIVFANLLISRRQ